MIYTSYSLYIFIIYINIYRHIDIADMTLDTSILSIDMIRFYAHKAKKDLYYADFGYVTLDKMD